MKDFLYVPATRVSTLHFWDMSDQRPSYLCGLERPVTVDGDLVAATCTNRREAVTCAKCKALLAARREGGER